jgi:phosphatidylglycerophosphate synthase
MNDLSNRRPLKSRGAGWAKNTASGLAGMGVSPDEISFAAVLFAVTGCALFVTAGFTEGLARAASLVGAAACVQLRLLCNLFDGMVAVEHGKGSAYGPIWNELPDRLADVLFLVGAGYGAAAMIGAGVAPLGWLAAVLAVLTAYIRELGRGLGLAADFSGPMAKPQRMATLTAAGLVAAAEPLWGWNGEALSMGLAVIVAGAIATVIRRTLRLGKALKAKG